MAFLKDGIRHIKDSDGKFEVVRVPNMYVGNQGLNRHTRRHINAEFIRTHGRAEFEKLKAERKKKIEVEK
jgi:hypothetical protein